MAKTLAQIQKQIAQLQEQAKTIRQKEISGVVARIREAIEHYGLSAEDLGLSGAAGGRKARKPRKAVAKKGRRAGAKNSVVKFRDEAGNTWTGRGRRPKWFTDALAAGKTPEQMAA